MRRGFPCMIPRRRIGESRPCPQRRTGPRGLTLLEVLVSTAIFLGALTAIMEIMRIGHDSRLSARMDAEAALYCESIMSEIVSGVRPVSDESAQIENQEYWQYSISTEDGGGEGLIQVNVLVEHRVGDNLPAAYFQLRRLMRDPQMFLDAALSASESAE